MVWQVVKDQDFLREIKSLEKRRDSQLLDDFNNEMAGRVVGRIARFLPEAAERHDASGKKKALAPVMKVPLLWQGRTRLHMPQLVLP